VRLRSVILFGLLMAGQVCTAQSPAIQLRQIEITPQVQEAQQKAILARHDLIQARENVLRAQTKAETENSPTAQANLQNAEQQVIVAQNSAAAAQNTAKQLQSDPVTEQQWGRIRTVLREFKDRFAKSMNQYSTLATSLVLTGIVLGLVSAVAGLGKKSIVAGVVSILVTGVISVPKVFPINERAAYYRALFNQSSALLLQTQLRLNPTVADYNDFVKKISLLSDYETTKFPAGGDVATNTEIMIKEIETSNGN
jgi:hypothetical protein